MKSGNNVMRGKMYPPRLGKRDGKETKKNRHLRRLPKFTKRAGKKREYNKSGWNHEGIHFFIKVCNKWKKLASKNQKGTWEQLEAEWNEYIEDNNF